MKKIILKDGTTFEIILLASNAGYGTVCKSNSELDALTATMSNSNLSEFKIVTDETGETEVIKDKTVTGIKTFQIPGGEVKAEFYIANQDNTAIRLEEANQKLAETEKTVTALQSKITSLLTQLSVTQDALDYIMFSSMETELTEENTTAESTL